MELQENSVIIDDKLDRMLEPELGGHFTHAYCTAGQCEVTFNGQVFTMHEGDFAPLYGSRTKFYGILDYFYESAYINGFTPGLQNAYLGIIGKPAPKFSCSATYHYLATATELSGLDRTLGHSIELQASYKFSKNISLIAGYTQMTGTETKVNK